MVLYGYGIVFVSLLLLSLAVECQTNDGISSYKSETEKAAKSYFQFGEKSSIKGTRWAVLVAGSRGYANYRHQADICHAYQVLKKGGVKDENIIVFMYDDIAFSEYNPKPGIIINKPNGSDVYAGVPKDYTGDNCTAENLFAVILGNKSALTGGSGKVLETSPHDYIFIFYADHGSPGLIGMPTGGDVYAKDLMKVLKKKHDSKTYKSMVFYMEACESGSMFEGLLPNNTNIYVVTAANSAENSWAIYCPGDFPYLPQEYDTCLGDLFSISWMEDSDLHDLRKETLKKQYEVVRRRTGADNLDYSSHVMQYGNLMLSKQVVSTYIGSNPANNNYFTFTSSPQSASLTPPVVVNQQYDADILHLRHKYYRAPKGSLEKSKAKKKLIREIKQRKQLDHTMNRISTVLFGHENGANVLDSIRSLPGQALVEDWDCLKILVKTYEKYCGALSTYGKKYTRGFANMCNAGIDVDKFISASVRACVMDA